MIIRPVVKDFQFIDTILEYELPKGLKQLSIVVETEGAALSYGFDAALADAVVIAPGNSHTPIDLQSWEDKIEDGTSIYFSSDTNPTLFSLLCMKHVANL